MEGDIGKLTIKADRGGIVVYVPENMTVDWICRCLYLKFSENARAFQNEGSIGVSFRGSPLTHAQEKRIVDFLNGIEILHVRFVLAKGKSPAEKSENSEVSHVLYPASYAPHLSSVGVRRDEKPFVFRGDIGRRQTLEIKGSIIVIGNVARDATVTAGKSITVIGRLSGTAIAGKQALSGCFISATDMRPKLLQIGKVRGSLPEASGRSAVAVSEGGTIRVTYI